MLNSNCVLKWFVYTKFHQADGSLYCRAVSTPKYWVYSFLLWNNHRFNYSFNFLFYEGTEIQTRAVKERP